jgi:hypothetical protein
MAGLALTAATAGSYNYYLTNNLSYLYGAATWAVLFPYTFAVVRPLFTRLLKADEERKEEGTEGVIREWVTAHRGRVLLGVLATLFYLYAEASSGREVVKVVVNTV